MEQYVGPGVELNYAAIITLAIAPVFSQECADVGAKARETAARSSIDVNRPLITQVSRFGPWKDPLAMIDAYGVAKRKMPG